METNSSTAQRAQRLYKLWLDNDEGLYLRVQELAEESDSAYDLAQALKDMFEEVVGFDDMQAGPAMDLLSLSRDLIDWDELAQSYRDDMLDEEA